MKNFTTIEESNTAIFDSRVNALLINGYILIGEPKVLTVISTQGGNFRTNHIAYLAQTEPAQCG